MRNAAIAGLSALSILASSLPALAQGDASRPVIHVDRMRESPRIDGVLDDSAWAGIEPVSDFRQYEPLNGEPATERTEVFVGYDERFLYFGVRAYDGEPDRIVTRQYERDSDLDADDSISLAIDSLHDGRTALAFQANIAGTKRDLQLTETGQLNFAWDTIWYAKGRVDELGYTLEIAIPFFSLRFKPGEELEMGLNLERIIRRKNEKVNWPSLSRDYSFLSVSQYARMVGFEGVNRSVDLEIKPYGIGGISETPEESLTDGDAGLDVKWGVSSNVTADLTLNPDFAQVESDNLQVNLTRFSLFFPERRDFFLESADLFRFGLAQTAEIFFSRRIGIGGSAEVPIVGGARVYGQPGSTNFGLMTMRTGETGGRDGEQFSVARIKQNIFGRSSIGGIVTRRTGEPGFEDTTIGGDAQFLLGTNLILEGAVARSDRPGVESGHWFGTVTARERKDEYDWVVRYTDIGESFSPGIGFVRRPDQRSWFANFHYKPRPDLNGVRQVYFGMMYARVENHDNLLETEIVRPGFLVIFDSEDTLTILYVDTFERVPFPFPLADGVVIPPGDYDNRQLNLSFESNRGRRWVLRATHVRGSFYEGDLRTTGASLTFKPVPRVSLTAQHQIDVVDVPGGNFDSRLSRLFASYFYSPELTSRVAVQYSSLVEDFVLNARLRWIYTPGSEAWLVYDEGRRFGLEGPSLRDRALILKLVHNFHF